MPRVSGFEQLSRKILRFHFPDDTPIYNAHLPWLVSSKGNQFELDIYYPKKSLAFEINGIYHTIRRQQSADEKKDRLCQKNKIRLYSIESIDQLLAVLRVQFDKRQPLPKSLHRQVCAYTQKSTPNILIREIRQAKHHHAG